MEIQQSESLPSYQSAQFQQDSNKLFQQKKTIKTIKKQNLEKQNQFFNSADNSSQDNNQIQIQQIDQNYYSNVTEQAAKINKYFSIFYRHNLKLFQRVLHHQKKFSFQHKDKQKQRQLDKCCRTKLTKLKETVKVYIQNGPGIAPIRAYYNNQECQKKRYQCIMDCVLRIQFTLIKNFVFDRVPDVQSIFMSFKNKNKRLTFNKNIYLSLLHAQREMSSELFKIHGKVLKAIFNIDQAQQIEEEDIFAIFQLLRQKKSEQDADDESDKYQKSSKKLKTKDISIKYIAYKEPNCARAQNLKQIKVQNIYYSQNGVNTSFWNIQFQREVMKCYIKCQGDYRLLRQQLMKAYPEYPKDFNYSEVRIRFEASLRKIIVYLQLQFFWNCKQLNLQKIGYHPKKLLTINKSQRNFIFTSDSSVDCRLFMVDYYLNNYDIKDKSYTQYSINYRLAYLDKIIQCVISYLKTKSNSMNILRESQLEKEDTYYLKSITNGHIANIKCQIRQKMQEDLRKKNQQKKRITLDYERWKNITKEQIDEAFDQYKTDDQMKILIEHQLRRLRNAQLNRNRRNNIYTQVKFQDNQSEAELEEEQTRRIPEQSQIPEAHLLVSETTKQQFYSSRKRCSKHDPDYVDLQNLKGGQKQFLQNLKKSKFFQNEAQILKVNVQHNYFMDYRK